MVDYVKWHGASRNSYTFELYKNGQQFNSVSGVYIFCRNVAVSTWEALYVGETQSFKQRLNTNILGHDGYRRAQTLGATHIAVLLVNGEAERLRIETDLRHGLEPLANAQGIGRSLYK